VRFRVDNCEINANIGTEATYSPTPQLYMRPEQIKAELEGRGTNLADIGRRLDISHVSISRNILGQMRSKRIEAAIAAALDKPLHIVFPDRYQPPAGYVPPATIEVSAKELAQIKISLAQATRALELLGA
jgi:lambda repressor-like predicted transcriptional regulator